MELYELSSPKGSHKRKKLRGRGPSSGHGKTSCRGNKGQRSRSGHKLRPGFEGGQMPLVRRLPKRGFTSRRKKIFQIVNIKDLNMVKQEVIVDPAFLKEKNLIKDEKGLVKILADGEIKHGICVKAHKFTKSAEDKIKKAGGSTELIPLSKS